MGRVLLQIVKLIAAVHDRILALNDSFPTGLSDKQLHFLIIGAFGLLVIALLYLPLRALVRRGRTAALVWICAFLLVLAFCFAVEIGQYETRTGVLDVGDIAFGLLGFLAFSALWALLRLLIRLIRRLKKK